MPTVKLQGGKVVTKDGKVSCECCSACNFSQPSFAGGAHVSLTQAQYANLYAGGSWQAQASGNLQSQGQGGDFDVETSLTSSGTAANSYASASQTCSAVFGSGAPTSSVSATGSSTSNEPSLIFQSDTATGSMSANIVGFLIYNNGGTHQRGLILSASASYSAELVSVYLAPNSFGPPTEVFFGTQRQISITTQTGGASAISLAIGSSSINLPANTASSSVYGDSGSGSLSLSLTFSPSAP